MLCSVPRIEFNRTYGCRVFECWPQTVGSVDLSHDGGGSVATFDVTWAYHKWAPFKMEGVGSRSNINLNVGLMRNEKDGIPLESTIQLYVNYCVNQGNVTDENKRKLTDIGYYLLNIFIPNRF